MDLLAAHAHAANNRAEIEASSLCGCFHCLAIFRPAEIIAWSGGGWDAFGSAAPAGASDGETALCPRCGSESVLGDKSGFPITPQFLTRMNEAWHQRTIIRKPAPKK